jgi:hypothetical protein
LDEVCDVALRAAPDIPNDANRQKDNRQKHRPERIRGARDNCAIFLSAIFLAESGFSIISMGIPSAITTGDGKNPVVSRGILVEKA